MDNKENNESSQKAEFVDVYGSYDENLKYENGAIISIKSIIAIVIFATGASACLLIIGLASAGNEFAWLGLTYLYFSVVAICGIYITAQTFFYLKGIYEELKTLNNKK